MTQRTWLPAIVVAVTLVAGAGADDGWKVVFEETFDAGWTERWAIGENVGATDQGVLLSAGHDLKAQLKSPQFKAPALRVEFDAWMRLKGWGAPCSDLSVVIGPLLFQFGGERNTLDAVVSQDPRIKVASSMPDRAPLIKGANPKDNLIKHHVVAEINGRLCSLRVDDRQAAFGLLDRPLNQPLEIALVSVLGVAQFDNLKVQTTDNAAQIEPKRAAELRDAAAVQAREATRHRKPNMVVESLRHGPTIYSIGFEWDIEGDSNHNATCTMRYRKKGEETWKDATALLRIDYRGWYEGKEIKAYRHFNMFAGSLMFLEPATRYEVDLKIADPDGGEEAKMLEIATNAAPSLGKPARTLHVAPDDATGPTGIGLVDRPFIGLAAAMAAAKPGDLFLLRPGKYKGAEIKASGVKNRYIAFQSAEPGAAVITSHIGASGSYLWFQGFTFVTENEEEMGGINVPESDQPRHDLVVVRNTFKNCRYALSNRARTWNGDPRLLNRRWYIADNICDGGPWTEYFTRLYMLADGDISYNRITTTDNHKEGDAIALRFCTNMDAHHNDMRDISDDYFEPDSSYANIRMWCNRGINAVHQAVSFQPQHGSPWYIVRNEFVMLHDRRSATIFKTNVFDRNVIVNNTFVVRGRAAQFRANIMMGSLSRNNLWVHIYDNKDEKTNPTGAVWGGEGDAYLDQRYTRGGQSKPNWRTDVDYDGFAWDHGPGMDRPFWWDDHHIHSVAKLWELVGIEEHGVQMKRDEVFSISDLIAYGLEHWSGRRLTLRPDSKAIDAGAVVPNLSEDFEGSAPDIGAHETGRLATHYGPRDDMPW